MFLCYSGFHLGVYFGRSLLIPALSSFHPVLRGLWRDFLAVYLPVQPARGASLQTAEKADGRAGGNRLE